MATNPYGQREGLPEQAEYNPEKIGTAELQAGESQQVWDEYGLELAPIHLNDEDTGRRFVLRNGEYVSDVSSDYQLLPNEEAVAAADAVAEELGAVPFDQFGGDWYVQLDDHVFQDQDCHRAHALYAWDDPVDIGAGDDIQFGFAIHNSIDGSLSFQSGLFTFRHACANMVFMGVKGRGMNFDDREVIAHASHSHTSGLDVNQDALQATIKELLTLVDDVSDTYSAWRREFIEPEHVTEILDRARGSGQLSKSDLPAWMQRAITQIEKAEENETLDGEQELAPARRAEIAEACAPRSESTWDLYNDLTESIWHSDTTNDQSKRSKMKDVHRVLTPAEGLR